MYRMATAVVVAAGCAMPALAGPTAILQSSGFGANSGIDGFTFDRFDRLNKSGTGEYWVLLATNTTGSSSTDRLILTGQGDQVNLVAAEGVTDFGEPAGRFFSTSDRYMDINSSGEWVAIGNLTGGATNDDEVVYSGNFDGSSLSIPLREGDGLPGGNIAGTANYGPSITDAGDIGSVWDASNQPSSSDIVYVSPAGTLFLQESVSVPGNQRGGTTETLASPFGGRNATQWSSDGSSYVTVAQLSGGDQVLIKDGDVALQEGDDFGGKIIDSIRGEQNILQDNGDWLTRVRFTDGTGGAIKNGTLFAQSGDLVGGSVAGERWSEVPWTSSSDTTFAMVTGDSIGNVVLGGFTDNADAARNFVWTYNGSEFLRSGDQVDIDGDGALDDAFIFTSSFTTASPAYLSGFLADDGFFYTGVDLRNAAGDNLGNAVIRVLVPSPGVAGLLGVAGLAGLRRRR